jgi:Sulfotransferase family
MIISRSKKFIFVHIPKTAGSSIRRALTPYTRTLKGRFVKNVIRPPDCYHLSQMPPHTNAVQIRLLLGSEFYESAYSFAFVRNPWDREVSMYHYILKTPHHHMNSIVSGLDDFASYIRWQRNEAPENQHDFIATCRQGDIIVDHVARFENIADEYAAITSRIGVPNKLPKVNTSDRSRDYRSYYTDETREIVAELFATDIEKFGYEF